MFADVPVLQNKSSLWAAWGFRRKPPTHYLCLRNTVISCWREPSLSGFEELLLGYSATNTAEAMRFPFSQMLTFSPA